MDLTLDAPVQYVPRVGPRMATLLSKLGIYSVRDLITYAPFRYDDFSHVTPIRAIRPGETVTVRGHLETLSAFTTKNGKRMITARLRDESGSIDLTWFNQLFIMKVLSEGDHLSISGKAQWFGRKLTITSPVYERLEADEEGASLHTGRLVPIYPETGGLTSKWLRGRISYLLREVGGQVIDRIPEHIRQSERLMGFAETLMTVHFPENGERAAAARLRLAFEELFLLAIRAKTEKYLWQTTQKAPSLPLNDTEKAAFLTHLPFALTPDQEQAVADLITDLSRETPMNRLLEGDVGAGKTVVAAAGMYACYRNGQNAVLMAPTQILAEQHAKTLKTILETPHGIPVHLILGGTKKADRKPDLKPAVYVGTHALLSDAFLEIPWGYVVIDEQQRFGVRQRSLLRAGSDRNLIPHQLTMTATPIPRTVAQTVFGNLDLSTLRTLPKGRKPVKTWVVPTEKRTAAYGWIARELKDTHSQAFIVCPFIEESDSHASVKAVLTEYERLKRIFPSFSLGLLHGRLKHTEKTDVLEQFRTHAIDILVATPVVEVGIDIPDATVIVIEAAERFGLSQLHQLRGRVGRRDKPSYCLLFTEQQEDKTLTRLKALETIYNGPELAELDLRLRGPGELFGTRQHGISGLTLSSMTDTDLIARVQRAASSLMDGDPTLSGFPHLRETVKIATIGESQS